MHLTQLMQADWVIMTLIINEFEKPAQKLLLRFSSGVPNTLTLTLRRRIFSVFGTPDENLALVFDLLHETLRLMLDILPQIVAYMH